MFRKTPFILVDVFTSKPFGGNQLAVFTDAAALSPSEMQELAHEMNFSESTFVMPPDSSGARRVRIFTPKHEMPMAGHPTVGTTWVLASRGEIALDSKSVDATLQLGIGPVTVTVESRGGKLDFVWMAHREPEFGVKRDDRERIAEALGITAADIRDDLPIQVVSTGFPFIFVPVRTLDALAKCSPNLRALAALFKAGEPRVATYMFVVNGSGEFSARSRMFAPFDGVAEDPATGSAAAPFGAYAATYGLIKPAPKASFLIQQGVEMGRPSEIRVEVARKDGGALAIRIGGRCAIVGEGSMFL
ncbi:PhzF family phenazine biosynthesis protein [Candidatus Binatus sp.]|uniref:PhzF family phenazine biosynthesis protein n=1 Tax=Candidatus Binatus sp. TaxID=2811406 RepID=UPI003C99A64D